MFLVGLTGGVATGKSTVSRILSKEFGCLIVDADLIAREVVVPNSRAWRKIREHFGEDVLHSDGTINREKLGEIIFTDANKRKLLNSIVHPEIYKSMVWKIFKAFLSGRQFVVLDLPLLFETGKLVPYASFIIVVSCSQKQQLDRLMQRNSLSQEEAEQRINSQMPLVEKCRKATHVIDNSFDLENTKQQVQVIFQKLSESKLHWRFRIIFSLGLLTLFELLRFSLKILW